MSITGVPLMVVAVLCTLGALAGTVLLWGRGGRWRYVFRSAGVILAEASLLFAVGLIVNRDQQFYPTWASLFASGYTGGSTYAITPGRLDESLAATADGKAGHAVVFAWQPPGWTSWGLAAAPTLVVPADYLKHPELRYPVVVALTDRAGWPAPAQVPAATGSVVTVLVHPSSATAASQIGDLPAALTAALRVTGYRWAVVAAPTLANQARETVAAAPDIFGALGLLRAAAPAATTAGHPLPPGILSSTFEDTKTTAGWNAVLTWAADQLPPPLSASAPSVASLPPHHKGKPHASTSPSAPARVKSPAPKISTGALAGGSPAALRRP